MTKRDVYAELKEAEKKVEEERGKGLFTKEFCERVRVLNELKEEYRVIARRGLSVPDPFGP